MRDLFWPSRRTAGPVVRGLQFAYEKAGLVLRGEPIPWNADAVLADAVVRFPDQLSRRKSDFTLRVAGQPPIAAATMHRHEDGESFLLQFRLGVPRGPGVVEIGYRAAKVGQASLKVLGLEAFLDGVQIRAPAIHVRLGDQYVPCQAFVGAQGRGFQACGLLTSDSCLAPLRDLDCAVVFTERRSGEPCRVPIRLTSAQLSSHEATICVACPRRPRRLGAWIVEWELAGRVLARSELRVLSRHALGRSLYLADARFVVRADGRDLQTARRPPRRESGAQAGPSFLVASREPGIAALCSLSIGLQGGASAARRIVHEQDDVLITDAPTLFSPGLASAEDLADGVAFDLFAGASRLGVLPLQETPAARFSSEGGFAAAEEFDWTGAADDELSDRLGRLMDAAD
jgi:hypothetical protein